MVYAWSLPVYRQCVWLESFIDDALRWFYFELDRALSSNEALTHWRKHSYCQFVTTFTIIIGMSTLWILCSYLSSWKIKRGLTGQKASQASSVATITAPQPPDGVGHSSAEDQANDEDSAVATSRSPPTTARHVPFGVVTSVDGRADRVSTFRYQTPIAGSPGRRNFSHLKQTAPVSYATLQQGGVLDGDGTPTKKFSPAAHDINVIVSQVYDSSTRSWGKRHTSPEDQNEALWVEDEDDDRVQHFSPAKGKGKAANISLS